MLNHIDHSRIHPVCEQTVEEPGFLEAMAFILEDNHSRGH